MQITAFHPAARLAYANETSTTGNLIALYHRGQAEAVAAFCDRWNLELQALPAHAIQFLVAYSIAATGADPNFYQRDRGGRRAIWKSFDPKFLDGDPALVFAEHGMFALTIPTARQISGKIGITRNDLLAPEVQFTIASAIAGVLLKKYEFDYFKTAIAFHTGYLKQATNELQIGYRGEFPYKFITAFNSYTEWRRTTQPQENEQ